jgi:hypothetical protein
MFLFSIVIPAVALLATGAIAEPDTVTLTMQPSSLTLPKDHAMFELPTESQRKNLGVSYTSLRALFIPRLIRYISLMMSN